MTRNYRVEGPDGTTTAGKNQAVAKQWLHELQKAVEDQEVVALPFADPDLASLAHHGKNVTGSLSHLQDGHRRWPPRPWRRSSHVKPRTDFAWPVDGAVDPSIVDVATSAGAAQVIARSDSLRETGGLPYTPDRGPPHRRRHHGGRRGRPAVHGLPGRHVEGRQLHARRPAVPRPEPDDQPPGPGQAAQHRRRPAAHAHRPARPRRWPRRSRRLEGGSWTQPLDLVARPPRPSPTPAPPRRCRRRPPYPPSLRKQELPHVRPSSRSQDTQDTLDNFKVILTEPVPRGDPLRQRAMNREMSTSWRGRAAGRHGVPGRRRSVPRRPDQGGAA